MVQGLTMQMGGQAHEIAAKVDHCVRGMVGGSGASLFEELGIYYIGPVDGHNVEDLVYLLKQVKAMPTPGPVLIHVITEKGKGYPPAEIAADKMHGKKPSLYPYPFHIFTFTIVKQKAEFGHRSSEIRPKVRETDKEEDGNSFLYAILRRFIDSRSRERREDHSNSCRHGRWHWSQLFPETISQSLL